jgi:hypothetical protein
LKDYGKETCCSIWNCWCGGVQRRGVFGVVFNDIHDVNIASQGWRMADNPRPQQEDEPLNNPRAESRGSELKTHTRKRVDTELYSHESDTYDSKHLLEISHYL